MNQRLYKLNVINHKTGTERLLNTIGMTHHQACTMRSKFTSYRWRTIQLIEVTR